MLSLGTSRRPRIRSVRSCSFSQTRSVCGEQHQRQLRSCQQRSLQGNRRRLRIGVRLWSLCWRGHCNNRWVALRCCRTSKSFRVRRTSSRPPAPQRRFRWSCNRRRLWTEAVLRAAALPRPPQRFAGRWVTKRLSPKNGHSGRRTRSSGKGRRRRAGTGNDRPGSTCLCCRPPASCSRRGSPSAAPPS